MKRIQSDVNSPDRYRLQMSDGEKHQPCELLFCVPRMKYGAPCTAEIYHWLCRLVLDSSCCSSSASCCQFFFFFFFNDNVVKILVVHILCSII